MPVSIRFRSFRDLRTHLAMLGGSSLTTTGSWNPGQVYFHLAASIEASCELPRARRSTWARFRKLPMRWYALRIGLPRGAGIPASVQDRVRPPAEVDESEQRERLASALQSFDANAPAAATHPILGPLTRDEWRRFHLRHCELHLSHIVILDEQSRVAKLTTTPAVGG